MSTIFLACFVLGTTVLAAQIVLAVVGIGAHGAGLDASPLDAPHADAHVDVPPLEGPHLGATHLDAPPPEPALVEAPALDAHATPGGDSEGPGAAGMLHGLDLLSVRALSAGVAMFGAAGLGFARALPAGVAAAFALPCGVLAAAGTAWAMRQMLRLESSGSLRLEGAVGRDARVYLTVPARSLGSDRYGLIHVSLQGRTVELRAVTREADPLPTGSSAVVIAVSEDGCMVEVVPPSIFEDPRP